MEASEDSISEFAKKYGVNATRYDDKLMQIKIYDAVLLVLYQYGFLKACMAKRQVSCVSKSFHALTAVDAASLAAWATASSACPLSSSHVASTCSHVV